MTKHAKSTPPASAKPPALGCPAAAIARRLAIVEREIEALDEAAGPILHGEDARRERSLFDLEDLLIDQATWARPVSAAGALASAVLLLRGLREVDHHRRIDPPDEIGAEKWERAVGRLGDALVAYLSASGRTTVEDLGLARVYLEPTIEREVQELAGVKAPPEAQPSHPAVIALAEALARGAARRELAREAAASAAPLTSDSLSDRALRPAPLAKSLTNEAIAIR